MPNNTLEIKLQNCFGIGNFDYKFEFGSLDTNTFLIYGPNGTMKSSFSKTLELISKKDITNINDRVYNNRDTKFQIKLNDSEIIPESILVVNAEDANYDASTKISSFIASRDLKLSYDKIFIELEKEKNEYIKKLKLVSQSTDCESELTVTFQKTPKDTFFEIISSISELITTNPSEYNFRYNDIFDKKGNVKKFLEKNQKLLGEYIKNYNDLLEKSKFFKKSKNSFGTIQANELLKSTEDNSYFEAGHKFILNDNYEINSAKELKELLQTEITSIINDEKLKKSFELVDKAIGANAELRSFKTAIENNNLLLIELENYEEFRNKVWLSFISKLKAETLDLVKLYGKNKIQIEEIIKKAKKEFEIWNKIIMTFNERFYVPFEIKLINQEDVILKQESANLQFDYKELNEISVVKDKNSLLTILSKGEQRAFYILQLLFDIESRKELNQDTLLIFDDIADSFDYKNKYAIIEYLKEVNENSLFKSIILTHNFDFYRTVANRLGLDRKSILMAIKNQNREIILKQGEYLKNIFDYFKKNLSNPKIFIGIIPLLRNLVEYIEGFQSENYQILTSCLHFKSGTSSIECSKIISIIQNSFSNVKTDKITFASSKVLKLIYQISDEIETDPSINEILLENKLSLSLAIRLKAEEFMLSKIPNSDTLDINSNQYSELLKIFKQLPKDNEVIEILERVNLMTPENIHVNAFMIEPLIDISIFHLVDLYKKVKLLQ